LYRMSVSKILWGFDFKTKDVSTDKLVGV